MRRAEAFKYNEKRHNKELEIKAKEEFITLLTTKGVFFDRALPEQDILEYIKSNFSPELLAYLNINNYPASLDEFSDACVKSFTGDINLASNFRNNVIIALRAYQAEFTKNHPGKQVYGSFAERLNEKVYKLLQDQSAVSVNNALPSIEGLRHNGPTRVTRQTKKRGTQRRDDDPTGFG